MSVAESDRHDQCREPATSINRLGDSVTAGQGADAIAETAAVGQELAALRARLSETQRRVGELESQLAEQARSRAQIAQERDAAVRDLHMVKRAHDAVLQSRGYRLLGPLRRWSARHPRVRHATLQAVRAARLIQSLQFARIMKATRLRWRWAREARFLRASGLFDSQYYLATYPDVRQQPMSAVEHYVRVGGAEGRNPSALFDGAWYLRQNPDLAAARSNPLTHYLSHGRSEGRDPNPFFDTVYYRERNPDLNSSALDPITHYLRIGAKRSADPSPYFDSRWYLDQNPDIAAAGMNPLVHFLRHGQLHGRLPRRDGVASFVSRPVYDAKIRCLKMPTVVNETALFVTHSRDGRLKPHVRWYLEALAKQDIGVILIVATDRLLSDQEMWVCRLVQGLFVRANEGYDFAAWAHVLRLHREIYRANSLYLLNDSILGPTNNEAFGTLVASMRARSADVVGLTDSHEGGWHVQSYFLLLKQPVFAAYEFHRFILDVVSFADKEDVIKRYELRFAPAMRAAGLAVAVLFPAATIHNPTTHDWKDLLRAGFPFFKVVTARADIPNVDKTGWREELAGRGYDVTLADGLLDEVQAKVGAAGDVPPVELTCEVDIEEGGRSKRIAFIGPWNFDNGLGVASRGYIEALMHADMQVNLSPIRRPFHVHRRVSPTVQSRNFVGPPDVALVHLNAEAWSLLLDEELKDIIDRAAFKVGLYVWESRTLPDYVVDGLSRVDMVWAPSTFCAESYRERTVVPVEVIPYVVPVRPNGWGEKGQRALRGELALADGDRVILYAFDSSSYLVRKNPAALVTAFGRTGLARRGWRLVLKTKHIDPQTPDASALLKQAGETPGVTILDRTMDAKDIANLMELADVYASPHCSEGFGLTIAEAMAKGKLVVASDYGGSRDFLDSTCGFPVRCSEWMLDTDQGAYKRGTIWGLVDNDHLVETLLTAADTDGAERDGISARARQRIEDRLSPRVVASAMRASIDRLLSNSAFH